MTRRALAAVVAVGGALAACGGPSAPAHRGPTVVDVPPPRASARSVGSASVPVSGDCRSDADCAPTTCCHPRACAPAWATPRCEGIVCTMDCRPGTMDCGGGACLCQAGACVAQLHARGG